MEVSDVHRASRCFSATTVVGVDHWHPRSILDLPKGAVLGFTALLNQCEQGLMWPTRTFLSVIALLPKSVDCHRPMCKCPTLYR
eukprot:8149420-Pyramimonas_sp.AAC.1